jgi:hypothetical protein
MNKLNDKITNTQMIPEINDYLLDFCSTLTTE